MLESLREKIHKFKILITCFQRERLLSKLISLKLQGYVTTCHEAMTEGDLERIIYEEHIEKRRKQYKEMISKVFKKVLSD